MAAVGGAGAGPNAVPDFATVVRTIDANIVLLADPTLKQCVRRWTVDNNCLPIVEKRAAPHLTPTVDKTLGSHNKPIFIGITGYARVLRPPGDVSDRDLLPQNSRWVQVTTRSRDFCSLVATSTEATHSAAGDKNGFVCFLKDVDVLKMSDDRFYECGLDEEGKKKYYACVKGAKGDRIYLEIIDKNIYRRSDGTTLPDHYTSNDEKDDTIPVEMIAAIESAAAKRAEGGGVEAPEEEGNGMGAAAAAAAAAPNAADEEWEQLAAEPRRRRSVRTRRTLRTRRTSRRRHTARRSY